MHEDSVRAADADRDRLRLCREPAAVHRLAHDRIEADQLGRPQRIVPLQPGQVDDVLHQLGQPTGLGLHPAGEPTHGLRVVRGVEQRLREQCDGPHGCLELVADVGDEVTAYGVDAPRFGAVLDEQEDKCRAERGDPGEHRVGAAAEGSAGQLQFGLADLTVASDRAGKIEQVRRHDPVVSHDAVGVGRRTRSHHLVGGVEDDRGGAQHRQHVGDPRRKFLRRR